MQQPCNNCNSRNVLSLVCDAVGNEQIIQFMYVACTGVCIIYILVVSQSAYRAEKKQKLHGLSPRAK
jgi:hypothetical protein